jgi:hypothetical protein
MYFWAIPKGSDRASAFLSWVEELPVAMVNHLPLTAPTDPGDLLAIATLEARLDGWSLGSYPPWAGTLRLRSLPRGR